MNIAKKTYLISAAILILGFCLLVFMVFTLFFDIKKDSEEILAQKKNLVFLQDEISALGNFRDIYDEVGPNLEKMNSLFIDSEIPIGFVDFLEKTSKDCGITINISLVSGNEKNKGTWNSLSFQMAFTSSPSKFLIFLEKIENSPYLIEIKSLNINRLSEGDIRSKDYEGFSVGDVSVNLLITIYAK